MVRKILIAVFFLLDLASSAVHAQMLTTVASNNSVAADVWNGSGLIDFYIPANPKERLSFPQHSYLTVEINGKFYTNNTFLITSATPAFPNILTNGSYVKISDTIRTSWIISDSFKIIQDVYPVTFSISGSGQIVYKISVANLTNTAISAQAQFLYDNEISSNSPPAANDNDTLATRAGYSPKWVTFPNADYNGVPPFELAFGNGLCASNGFPGIIGVGFTNDSLAPEPMGLMTPMTYSFVDWATIVQNWTWGFPTNMMGLNYEDAATLIQWPSNSAGPNSEIEIARGSYGIQLCQTCFGNLDGMIFHPEHIAWNGSDYNQRKFTVEAVVFDPNVASTLESGKATQIIGGPIQIVSPQPSTNNGQSQQHSTNPSAIQSCELGDIIWYDSVDNSLVDCIGDSLYNIEVTIQGSGIAEPFFLAPCTCPIQVDCQKKFDSSVTFPFMTVLSRTGSFDGSMSNARCTHGQASDPRMCAECGIKSVTPMQLQNMTFEIEDSASWRYCVCVIDSMQNGSSTVVALDGTGQTDTAHYTYSTIADMKAPLVLLIACVDTVNGPCQFQVSDTEAWDRGLDTVYFSNVVNETIYLIDIIHGHGIAGFSAQKKNGQAPGSFCITAIDLAGNKFDTCFGSSASVSQTSQTQLSLSISPNPTSGDVSIFIEGAPSAEVEIFDVLGREVDRFSVAGSYEWQTSGFPAGTYILRASVSGQMLTKRIIKE